MALYLRFLLSNILEFIVNLLFGIFDLVYYFSVITEITDLSVRLTALANATEGKAYIELALAKPLLSVSRSPS